MKCKKCKEKAVFDGPNYCKAHFIPYLEDKVKKTIKDYKLLSKKEKVVVAVSGGKDSLTVLYLLAKSRYDVEGIAIDEGIAGYRNYTLRDLKIFSEENGIKIKIISVKKEFGNSLDQMTKSKRYVPCTICGVLRRYLLNKYSKKYDKIVTGHNLDDEAQAIMMNLLRNQPEISARLGPASGLRKFKGFTPRVKPLYFCTEKEIMTYAIIKGFQVRFTECPYTRQSFRSKVRDMLNSQEMVAPGTKMNLVTHFLENLKSLKKAFRSLEEPQSCRKCKEPSKNEICTTCHLIDELIG